MTGQTVANEQTSNINQALGFFSTALLVFAFISLFVGGFTIFNTFSIIVGQRTRELALLRIVGASRRQVFRSVLIEAAIVGLVSSLIGLGLGVLAAAGLEALLKGFGISLPSGSLVFEAADRDRRDHRRPRGDRGFGHQPSPARRAHPARGRHQSTNRASRPSRHDGASSSARSSPSSVSPLLGIGLTKPAIQLVGLGAVAIFIGIGMLAPIVARPMSSVIGRPLARLFKISGKLGRENSMRSPRRTAQTASALMVGLALVSTITVFGASLSKSATSSVDNAVSADYIVTSTGNGPGGFSNSVSTAASAVPGVATASTVYSGDFEFRGSVSSVTAVSAKKLSDTIILRMSSGSGAGALSAGQLLIDTTTANSDNLVVGSTVPVKFAQTGSSTMRIGGIYKPNALLGSFLVGDSFFLSHFHDPLPVAVLLSTTSGAPNVTHALNGVLNAYPNIQIQTRAQFEKSQQAQVNQLLGLVYALLALAVVIALIGIVNTLMLSVFERTHEIGLLRAVGMKRRQIRAMIRSESVILSLFGAIIGVIVGTALGTAFAASLKQQGITDLAVPYGRLVVFLIIAALLGLGAASWPARRAAKLDVLAAIAAD